MNVKSEKFYQKEIQDYLTKDGWWVRKLHGERFQTGLPDLIACSPEGKLVFIEIKRIKLCACYTCLDIVSLLKGPQTGNILLLAKRKAPLCIIAGCNNEYLLAKVPFRLQDNLYLLSLEQIAKELRSL